MKKLAKSLTEQAGREDARKNPAAKWEIATIKADYREREQEARNFAHIALNQRNDIHYTEAYVDAFRATLIQIWVTTLQAPEKARKSFRDAAKRHETLESFYRRAEKLTRDLGFTGPFRNGTLTFRDFSGAYWDFGSIHIRDESIWSDRSRHVDPDNPARWLKVRDIRVEISLSGGSQKSVAELTRDVNRRQEVLRIAAELECIAREARVAYFEGDFSDILGHSNNRATHSMTSILTEWNKTAQREAQERIAAREAATTTA